MKRILLLVTLALMLAAALALSGVALAKPTIATKADTKCLAEAAKTVDQPGFKPSDYTFHGGTEGNDNFTDQATAGPDVFCGFGGDDQIFLTLNAGDIFLGGPGDDFVAVNAPGGIFYGGPGDDHVSGNRGTFFGGEGFDTVRSGNDPVDGPEVP